MFSNARVRFTHYADVSLRMGQARKLAGFFFALAGEAPQNVPAENMEAYFDACREFGRRSPDACPRT